MTTAQTTFDVAVAGSGIAGASAAAAISSRGKSVVVLEQERQYPYHATGRSAALFACSYFSSPEFAALTLASKAAYESPEPGFTDTRLVSPRGALYYAGIRDAREFVQLCMKLGQTEVRTLALNRPEVLELVPFLKPENVVAAIYEPEAHDMDVNAIFRGFERKARRFGTSFVTGAELLKGEWNGSSWTIVSTAGEFRAGTLINASGAWGDEVARRCGVAPKNLQPLRRTAMTISASKEDQARLPDHTPFFFTAKEDLYARYSRGEFLISLSDTTPSAPCDAQPEDEDVALAIQNFEEQTDIALGGRRPRPWAGLRTFAPDKRPIVGFEDHNSRFFWLCGQGGYGIQTADAMARLTAGLLCDGTVPTDIAKLGLKAEAVSPGRFDLVAA